MQKYGRKRFLFLLIADDGIILLCVVISVGEGLRVRKDDSAGHVWPRFVPENGKTLIDICSYIVF